MGDERGDRRQGGDAALDALGRDALGRDALGRDALGRDALGRDALGRDALGRDALGRDALAREALDRDGGLLVVGPRGSGRSTVLASVAEREQGRRRVWWCRGHHVGAPSGEAALWCDDDAGALAAAGAQPTTVVADDVDLLDDSAVDRLVLLAERRRDLGLRLVAARRSAPPPRPALARLDGVLLGPHGAFHLGPLTAADVAAWWGAAVAPSPSPSPGAEPGDAGDAGDAGDLVARTGGWPELVAAELAAPGTGVADLANARLALLAADHQPVLRALAFGLPVGSRTVTEATGASPGDVDAAVAAARAVGLIHAGATPVPAVAAALRAAAPSAERARIAAAVWACGPTDLVVATARHLLAAGDRSAEAGDLYVAAAEALLVEAPADALDLLDGAERTGRPHPALAPLRAAAALGAGRIEDAVAFASRATGTTTLTRSAASAVAPGSTGRAATQGDAGEVASASRAAGTTAPTRSAASAVAPGSAGRAATQGAAGEVASAERAATQGAAGEVASAERAATHGPGDAGGASGSAGPAAVAGPGGAAGPAGSGGAPAPIASAGPAATQAAAGEAASAGAPGAVGSAGPDAAAGSGGAAGSGDSTGAGAGPGASGGSAASAGAGGAVGSGGSGSSPGVPAGAGAAGSGSGDSTGARPGAGVSGGSAGEAFVAASGAVGSARSAGVGGPGGAGGPAAAGAGPGGSAGEAASGAVGSAGSAGVGGPGGAAGAGDSTGGGAGASCGAASAINSAGSGDSTGARPGAGASDGSARGAASSGAPGSGGAAGSGGSAQSDGDGGVGGSPGVGGAAGPSGAGASESSAGVAVAGAGSGRVEGAGGLGGRGGSAGSGGGVGSGAVGGSGGASGVAGAGAVVSGGVAGGGGVGGRGASGGSTGFGGGVGSGAVGGSGGSAGVAAPVGAAGSGPVGAPGSGGGGAAGVGGVAGSGGSGGPAEAALGRVAGSGGAVDAALGRVAGAAWSHLAAPALAAESYLGADQRVLAVLPLLAAGRLDEARRLLSDPDAAAPAAACAFAEGAVAWMAGDSAAALAALERSAQLAQVHGGVEDWPDSPHAILALAAAQWLDTARADRVARTAIERSVGGRPFAGRHRLVAAWVALRGGRLDDARAALEGVPAAPRDMVRDAVTAAAVRVAVALRSGEPDDLPQVHQEATRARHRAPVPDPFAPDLAGELAHLAARVGDDPEPILGPLEQLAAVLGDPATLTVPLGWARLMVAVARDDAAGARAASDRLAAAAAEGADTEPGDPGAREAVGLLAEAARAFADVLGGEVDADVVQAVAARLTARGMVFEAARLVGAASLRCTDSAATRALLGELRRLRATQVRTGGRRQGPAAELSEREREVARALLDGHTHREIGARLFISAKTVEHHVARIRQKLGATATRADLLAAIRDELDRADGAAPVA